MADREQIIEKHIALVKEVKGLVKQEAEMLSKHFPPVQIVETADKIAENLSKSGRYPHAYTADEKAAIRLALEFAIVHTGDDGEVVWIGKNSVRWLGTLDQDNDMIFMSRQGQLVRVENVTGDMGEAPPQILSEVHGDELLERYREFTFENEGLRNKTVDSWHQTSARVEKLLRS